ncbi:hypothetical protein ACYPKM_04080 [Pseudomonas aeruginosa]
MDYQFKPVSKKPRVGKSNHPFQMAAKRREYHQNRLEMLGERREALKASQPVVVMDAPSVVEPEVIVEQKVAGRRATSFLRGLLGLKGA